MGLGHWESPPLTIAGCGDFYEWSEKNKNIKKKKVKKKENNEGWNKIWESKGGWESKRSL